MDDDVIEALADAFAERLAIPSPRDTHYGTILADIVAVGCVINELEPTYDLRYFYRRANFPEPYPEHEMR